MFICRALDFAFLRKWDDLPENMKNENVKSYYELLNKKRISFFIKRLSDFIIAVIALIILSPLFLLIGIVIKADDFKSPVMFRQTRITQYGKKFRIYKFRTMVNRSDENDAQLTLKQDARITKIGRILRKYRLDEFPQLLNVLSGNLSFVGTRPEVVRYTARYTEEMMATLLLPAGITSEASIMYKDEEQLLVNGCDIDETYVNTVMAEKMKYNLKSLEVFNNWIELKLMIRTVLAVMKSDTCIENRISNSIQTEKAVQG